MASLDFLSAFYSHQYSRDGLLKGLDGLLGAGECDEVRALPFYCPGCSEWWEQQPFHGSRQTKLLKREGGVSLFRITVNYTEQGHSKKRTGCAFVYEHPEFSGVNILLSLEGSTFFQRALRPLVETNYPRTLTTFISHRKLRGLLDRFVADEQLPEVRIKRASVRVRWADHERRRKVMPLVSWPDMDLAEAFDWVHEQNGWFQSLLFEVSRAKRLAMVSFSREGELKTTGLFQTVFSHFVEPVCKTLHENVQFFQRRSRQDNPRHFVRPLMIEFDGDQFPSTEDNQRFIGAMRRLSRASVSVLHGNPYIHLSVLDYYDGSSFDVWVVSRDKIVIVPQFRGSFQSIKRLINHVFDTFAEGRIRDYSEAIA
ncbi:hypothetical protein ACFL09_04340 [Planctomycetota bacterium]